jgi:hypothetical protein
MHLTRTAHRSGVTLATSTLGKTTLFAGTNAVFTGLSVTFRTGAANALEKNAILKSATALHVSIGRAAPFVGSVGTASVSTQIATLRRLLLSTEIEDTETGHWFHKASKVSDSKIVLIVLLIPYSVGYNSDCNRRWKCRHYGDFVKGQGRG